MAVMIQEQPFDARTRASGAGNCGIDVPDCTSELECLSGAFGVSADCAQVCNQLFSPLRLSCSAQPTAKQAPEQG